MAQLDLVGSTAYYEDNIDPNDPRAFTLDIPDGTQPGDLMVLGEITYPGVYSDPGAPFTKLWELNAFPAWGQVLWVGVYEGDDTPLAMSGSGASSNIYQRWFAATLGVFRPPKLIEDVWAVAEFPTIPAVDATAGISVVWGRADTSGFVADTWVDTPWTKVIDSGDYATVEMATWQGSPITEQTASATSNSFPLNFATIGVQLGSTPVRQYPRDDGLGHSSAPRKYPPLKAARIVGGYT